MITLAIKTFKVAAFSRNEYTYAIDKFRWYQRTPIRLGLLVRRMK